VVKKGRVRVSLAFEDKDFSLAILEKGDIYSTHTRSYVMALEDVELLIMPTAKFHQFMISFPVFSNCHSCQKWLNYLIFDNNSYLIKILLPCLVYNDIKDTWRQIT